ncbi:hypothetical protein BT69DRAFT_795434 [Atractiella rhizophila]|nr:hypothetical protein BT69DRAFT_795434 [Atractiella rhizophila]
MANGVVALGTERDQGFLNSGFSRENFMALMSDVLQLENSEWTLIEMVYAWQAMPEESRATDSDRRRFFERNRWKGEGDQGYWVPNDADSFNDGDEGPADPILHFDQAKQPPHPSSMDSGTSQTTASLRSFDNIEDDCKPLYDLSTSGETEILDHGKRTTEIKLESLEVESAASSEGITELQQNDAAFSESANDPCLQKNVGAVSVASHRPPKRPLSPFGVPGSTRELEFEERGKKIKLMSSHEENQIVSPINNPERPPKRPRSAAECVRTEDFKKMRKKMKLMITHEEDAIECSSDSLSRPPKRRLSTLERDEMGGEFENSAKKTKLMIYPGIDPIISSTVQAEAADPNARRDYPTMQDVSLTDQLIKVDSGDQGRFDPRLTENAEVHGVTLQEPRTVESEMVQVNDAKQSDKAMFDQQAFIPSTKPDAMALIHLITPSRLQLSLQISILPSFLSRLPTSIHTLRVIFDLPPRWKPQDFTTVSRKLSDLDVSGAIGNDGVVNLFIVHDLKSVTATFSEPVFVHLHDLRADTQTFTTTFPVHDRSNAIFSPLAVYSSLKRQFVPIHDERCCQTFHQSSVTIIQVSLPTSGVIPCHISRLPVELLSIIMDLLALSEEGGPTPIRPVSEVCALWRVVSTPYWDEPASAREKHARLGLHRGAGRLWRKVSLARYVKVATLKEIIEGSPNVTKVYMDEFRNEKEAKMVLNAIDGLERLEEVTFGSMGLNKWKTSEIEELWRIRQTIRKLTFHGVEDSSPPSAPSALDGLRLPPGLTELTLRRSPIFPLPILPTSLKRLALSDMRFPPPCISRFPLPPLLENLSIQLAPYSPDGTTSILSTPLDLSHLAQLTYLYLDGGGESSGLITLTFATVC